MNTGHKLKFKGKLDSDKKQVCKFNYSKINAYKYHMPFTVNSPKQNKFELYTFA